MLNRLWLGFFLTAALAALMRWLVGGDSGVFAAMIGSLFDMAKLSVEVMILLFGTLTLWLGLLRIAERAGFSIGSDAHTTEELDFLPFGMATAALAGIPRTRILNYRPVEFVRAWARGEA